MKITPSELANIMQHFEFSPDQKDEVSAILAQDNFDTVSEEVADLAVKTHWS